MRTILVMNRSVAGNYLASARVASSVWFMPQFVPQFYFFSHRFCHLDSFERFIWKTQSCLTPFTHTAFNIQHFLLSATSFSCCHKTLDVAPSCCCCSSSYLPETALSESRKRSVASQGRSCIHDLALPFALWAPPLSLSLSLSFSLSVYPSSLLNVF